MMMMMKEEEEEKEQKEKTDADLVINERWISWYTTDQDIPLLPATDQSCCKMGWDQMWTVKTKLDAMQEDHETTDWLQRLSES